MDSVTDRQVVLEGQPNCRDLGGLTTDGGMVVRRREIYRSGQLTDLSDDDLAVLESRRIRTVVNLLTDGDVGRVGENRLPNGAEEVRLPIDSAEAGELADRAGEALRTGDFAALPPTLNPQIHRLLTVAGRDRYRALLELIAEPDRRPLLFHCSHGVHRTGTAAAILLSVLGVPWDVVRNDYLLSNQQRAAEVRRHLAHLRRGVAGQRGVEPEAVDLTNATAFLVQQPEYIDASRDAILDSFASFDAYALDGLGIDEHTLSTLRGQLLTEPTVPSAGGGPGRGGSV